MARTIARETLLEPTLVAQNSTAYTGVVQFHKCSGDASVLFISTAGDITINQQVSFDNRNWYDPVDNAGSAVGTIATNATVTTGTYVSYSPVLAPYARYKIVENNTAATTVTVYSIFQEDDG
jgi:hypothetical protein